MPLIHLNGEPKKIDRSSTLDEILKQFKIRREAIAVAVNEEIVPRSRLDDIKVQEGDRIEIVHAVGGG